MVLFLIKKIKNKRAENVKKFTNVKLYGEKPNTVITPSKNGVTKIVKILLFSNAIKLNLKSFFLFYSFYYNPFL